MSDNRVLLDLWVKITSLLVHLFSRSLLLQLIFEKSILLNTESSIGPSKRATAVDFHVNCLQKESWIYSFSETAEARQPNEWPDHVPQEAGLETRIRCTMPPPAGQRFALHCVLTVKKQPEKYNLKDVYLSSVKAIYTIHFNKCSNTPLSV